MAPYLVDDPTVNSYNRSAAEFAQRTASFYPERALASFVAHVPPQGLVLDAGSGPGRDCDYLAALGLRPVAFDLARGMLLEGRRRGRIASAVQGDLRRLPFGAGVFRGVWANASLLHLPRLAFVPALCELVRVLGVGCLFLALKEGEGEAWRESPGGRRFFTYYSYAAVAAALREVGFAVIEHWAGPPGPDGYPWINLIALL